MDKTLRAFFSWATGQLGSHFCIFWEKGYTRCLSEYMRCGSGLPLKIASPDNAQKNMRNLEHFVLNVEKT